jgi:hypothetical protein
MRRDIPRHQEAVNDVKVTYCTGVNGAGPAAHLPLIACCACASSPSRRTQTKRREQPGQDRDHDQIDFRVKEVLLPLAESNHGEGGEDAAGERRWPYLRLRRREASMSAVGRRTRWSRGRRKDQVEGESLTNRVRRRTGGGRRADYGLVRQGLKNFRPTLLPRCIECFQLFNSS